MCADDWIRSFSTPEEGQRGKKCEDTFNGSRYKSEVRLYLEDLTLDFVMWSKTKP